MKTQDTAKLIEEIHETFFTEVNKLLRDANIFNKLKSEKQILIDKSIRLKKLGFTNTKEIKIAEDEILKIEKLKKENKGKEKLIETINYFRINYPGRKFITEESVKKICNKYGLVYGPVSLYMGVVPTPNLNEIEAFKIKDVDRCYKRIVEYKKSFKQPKITYVGGDFFEKKRKTKNPNKHQITIEPSPLEIAAPKKDFNLSGMTINDFQIEKKIEIPDPIVIHPVFHNGMKHYLILSAWGEEGYDELVFDEQKN